MKLFIPGPIWCREEVLKELCRQPLGHRTKEFTELYTSVISKLKKVLATEGDVHISTSSGSGVWELAVRNCVRRRALVCECGAFSQKWGNVAEMNGRETVRLKVEWGKAIRAEQVEDTLKNHEVVAVLFCHNETSTGVTSPIEEVAEAVRRHPDVLFLVDAVTSMAGLNLEVDKLGIDICLASVQKAFGLPPGAAVFTASERAYARAAEIPDRGYYFDLLQIKKSADKGQTLVTPCMPHIFALNYQLDSMLAEGMANRIERHRQMADVVREWARKNFALFAEPGFESNTLTCIRNTRGVDIPALNRELISRHDCIISDGYGDLKGKTFRIAHMGDMQVSDMRQLVAWIDEILKL
ncbi:MAG: alanine--glyoxylate aminotransferase family protein [Planctomycetia bacterium]|nr:alanine--glyoxylate aminotransferase family protein [Planctomycetia bacterium]